MRRMHALSAVTIAALFAGVPVKAHHTPDHAHDHFCECDILAEAGGLIIADGMARAVGAAARTGAGYFTVTNQGSEADRLVAAESPAAARVELHTHVLDATGVARMVELAEGIEIPPGETVVLEPGGLHVMFMGLTAAWEPEQGVPVTLHFERAGQVEVILPVEATGHEGSHHDHDDHDHEGSHHDHDDHDHDHDGDHDRDPEADTGA